MVFSFPPLSPSARLTGDERKTGWGKKQAEKRCKKKQAKKAKKPRRVKKVRV